MSTAATRCRAKALDSAESWLREALSTVPTPAGESSRDLVRQALKMQGPARVPYSFVQPLQSDFFELTELERRLNPINDLALGEAYTDAWQVKHEVAKGLFDQIVGHPLKNLEALADYQFPSANTLVDLEVLRPFVCDARSAGKYVVAADPVLGFERLRSLMGAESMLLAPRRESEKFHDLQQTLVELTVESIELVSQMEDVDSFMTWQDFGMQSGLMMRLEEFREHYKPGLAKAVRAAHEKGLDFILHCCGSIRELIPEFVEIGVDVLQLDQARLIGHEILRKEFGGEICFWNSVDTVWSSQENPTEEQIRAEVHAMLQAFADLPGGFMARHYPQPQDIGLSSRFHEISRKAFVRTEVLR